MTLRLDFARKPSRRAWREWMSWQGAWQRRKLTATHIEEVQRTTMRRGTWATRKEART